ncbi:MAG: tetratricopeptide repeat protein, partial [Nitrososphaeraceae archaeon]
MQKPVILFTVFFIIAGLNLFDYHDDVFAQVNASPFSLTSNNSQQTQESLESTNRDAILSYEQGNKFLNAKNYDQAITSYENAITLDPNWAAPLIKQGNSYFELANYTKAIE